MMIMSLMDNDNAIFVLSLRTTVTMYLYSVGSCPGVRLKIVAPPICRVRVRSRLPEKERRGFTVEYSTVFCSRLFHMRE